MELRQLRYFLAAAQELRFGQAAEREHVGASWLGAQIRALEREFGTPLFDREGRRWRLTEAGRLLLPKVARLLDDADAVRALASRAAVGGAV